MVNAGYKGLESLDNEVYRHVKDELEGSSMYQSDKPNDHKKMLDALKVEVGNELAQGAKSGELQLGHFFESAIC